VLTTLAEDMHIGMPESVDGLELVADEEDLLAVRALGEEVDELALEAVRVLELVDHDRAEAPALPLADVGVLSQEVSGEELKIFEVERRFPLLGRPIGTLEGSEQLLQEIPVAGGELVEGSLLDSSAGLLVRGRAFAAGAKLGKVEKPLGQRPLLQELEGAGSRGPRGLPRFRFLGEAACRILQLLDPRPESGPFAKLEDQRPPGRAQRRIDAGKHPPQGPSAVGGEQRGPLLVAFIEEVLQGRGEGLALEDTRLALVEDAKTRIDAGREWMRLQQPMAEPVDRRDPGPVELSGEVVAAELFEPGPDAAAELAGSAFGVRDHEQRVDAEAAVADRFDETLDEDGRLARPRSRRDEDHAGRVDGGDLLLARSSDVHAHARLTRHME
jgi:hypothetical protein